MIMTPKEKAKKETFVTLLEKLLKFDDRRVKHVNVTGDSCYSILLDVARAVYA